LITKFCVFLRIKLYTIFPNERDRVIFISGVFALVPQALLFLLGEQFEFKEYFAIGVALFAILTAFANTFLDYLMLQTMSLIRKIKRKKASNKELSKE